MEGCERRTAIEESATNASLWYSFATCSDQRKGNKPYPRFSQNTRRAHKYSSEYSLMVSDLERVRRRIETENAPDYESKGVCLPLSKVVNTWPTCDQRVIFLVVLNFTFHYHSLMPLCYAIKQFVDLPDRDGRSTMASCYSKLL